MVPSAPGIVPSYSVFHTLIELWARRAGKGLDVLNNVQEYRIKAEVRAGELLREMDKNKGVRLGGNKRLPPDGATKLKDVGVTKSQSSRWQAQASVPKAERERWIAETKAVKRSPQANG